MFLVEAIIIHGEQSDSLSKPDSPAVFAVSSARGSKLPERSEGRVVLHVWPPTYFLLSSGPARGSIG